MRSITRAILTAAALSLGLFAFPGSAQANLLLNGSFEEFPSTDPYWYSDRNIYSTPGWTQTGAGVDLMHNLQLYSTIDASDGLQFLDLNKAIIRSNGGIYQTVAATSGTTYSLTLDSVAWYPTSRGGSLRYELYDPFSTTVLATALYTDPYASVTWIPRAWDTLSLEATAISDSIGVRIFNVYAPVSPAMGLDNVVLLSQQQAVPEPGSLALLGLGLAGLAALRRRKQ